MFATDEDAINRGAVARVSDWLRSGGDVDARDATGRTLLMLAGPAHNVCSLAFGCPGLAVSDGRRARELYLLATVEDDSPAAAQPLCIGGSVPGEAASTDTHALPDKEHGLRRIAKGRVLRRGLGRGAEKLNAVGRNERRAL